MMKWKIVKHKDLSMAEELQIAYLKDQHWQYGVESQILWMKDNIEAEDAHLIGEEQDGDQSAIRAYITLNHLDIAIDSKRYSCIGVGGVCVDKSCQHMGTGQLLMKEAAKYINEQNKPGILLCKDILVSFYKRCGWNLLQYGTATVANQKYEHNIMLLGKACACSNITIEKNF